MSRARVDSDASAEAAGRHAGERRRHPVADKRLGQHFLFDPNILHRIALAAAPFDGCMVIEIGPGPGGLTAALLQAGARVVAIERDRRFLPPLAELARHHPGRLDVIEADALSVRPQSLTAGLPARIVANLPYNIATELLTSWLDEPTGIACLVLMFQKEVAARLVAAPGSKEYGRLTILAQWLCRVERLFDLPPGAFRPPPRVASSVVRLTPRADMPRPALRLAMRNLTRAAFGQRRKMLRSSLRGLGPEPEPFLALAGIEPTRRAEELSIADFRKLAQLLADEPSFRAGPDSDRHRRGAS